MQQNCHSDNFLDQLRAFPPPFGQSPSGLPITQDFFLMLNGKVDPEQWTISWYDECSNWRCFSAHMWICTSFVLVWKIGLPQQDAWSNHGINYIWYDPWTDNNIAFIARTTFSNLSKKEKLIRERVSTRQNICCKPDWIKIIRRWYKDAQVTSA